MGNDKAFYFWEGSLMINISRGALKFGLYLAQGKYDFSLNFSEISVFSELSPPLPNSHPALGTCCAPGCPNWGQWGAMRREVSLLWPTLDHSILKRCLGKAFLVDAHVPKKSNRNEERGTKI